MYKYHAGQKKYFSVFAVCVAIEEEEAVDVCVLFESNEVAASDNFFLRPSLRGGNGSFRVLSWHLIQINLKPSN